MLVKLRLPFYCDGIMYPTGINEIPDGTVLPRDSQILPAPSVSADVPPSADPSPSAEPTTFHELAQKQTSVVLPPEAETTLVELGKSKK